MIIQRILPPDRGSQPTTSSADRGSSPYKPTTLDSHTRSTAARGWDLSILTKSRLVGITGTQIG